MTAKLSPHKISRILRYYFSGVPQPAIARKVGVDQSTVSLYSSRFRESASEVGLLGAGKEFKVFNEVESLRSLSAELYKSKLTVEEARQGHNIIRAFQKLGVNPDQHHILIEVCQQVGDSGFVMAALKLVQIEAKSGMSYHQVIADFEKAQQQLPRLWEQIAGAKAELESTNDMLLQNKKELAYQEKYLKKYQNEVKAKVAQLENELLAKMKRLEVDKKQVEEVGSLKAELNKKGLNLETLIKLAKEFQHGSKGN